MTVQYRFEVVVHMAGPIEDADLELLQTHLDERVGGSVCFKFLEAAHELVQEAKPPEYRANSWVKHTLHELMVVKEETCAQKAQ